MSTSLPVKHQQTLHSVPTPSSYGRILRRVGVALLTIVVTVVSLIFAIPVLLLFIASAVPLLISLVLVVIDIAIVIALFRLEHRPLTIGAAVFGILLVSVAAVWLSQAFARTPPILDDAGNTIPNSIAVMEQVNLGGDDQWITIRGKSIDNPVLLFLAGGPGGSELAWTRQYLSALEDHFVVVNWDQPGAGKSYAAVDIATLTPERYVSDAYELTQLMRERFHQDKIYVLGESWGSILGTWLVQQYPELFHAYIASAQMVYTTLDDQMGYEFALQYATEQGNTAVVEQLRRTGSPPYTGPGSFWTYAAYLNVLNSYMYSHANGEGGGDNRLLDVITAPEYGLVDKVNWVRGLDEVFTNVYPRLGEIDMITNAPKLDVPVYFITGRWDVNAMTSLVERYYDVLEAPYKELIWFENSGHTPLYEEPRHFVDVMVNTVLADTGNR